MVVSGYNSALYGVNKNHDFRVSMFTYSHINPWDEITHVYHTINGGLAKVALKLRQAWLITSSRKL